MNKYEYIVSHHLNSINHHSGWKGCVPFLDEPIWFSLVCRVHRGFTLTLCSATLAKWCAVLCCWKHRQTERHSSFHVYLYQILSSSVYTFSALVSANIQMTCTRNTTLSCKYIHVDIGNGPHFWYWYLFTTCFPNVMITVLSKYSYLFGGKIYI